MSVPLVLISASKPDSPVAGLLREKRAEILPLPEIYSEAYAPGPRLIIFRKTPHSFLAAIQDKTLFIEAAEAAESDRLSLFVIEGEGIPESRAFHPNAARGAVTALILQYGASVLASASPEETADLIMLIAKQEQHGIPEVSLHPKRKAEDLPDLQRRVVEMLPGVGLVLARALLREFGTIRDIAAASPQALAQVKGLGISKAHAIRSVLHEPYLDVDSEKEIEDAIERVPSLLFDHPVRLLARQHRLALDDGTQGIIDMVFHSSRRSTVYIVEVKKAPITLMDYRQIKAYIQAVSASALIEPLLRRRAAIRGILASTAPSNFKPPGESVQVITIDKRKVLDALEASS